MTIKRNAYLASALIITAASSQAAIVVPNTKIVSGSATGTLVAIDAPFANNTAGGPTWVGSSFSQADQGFTTENNNLRDYRVNDKLWEPDGTDPAEAGSWFTYPGPSPSISWDFGAASGVDLPDGSVINAIYAIWFSRGSDGITYAYTEGTQSDTYVDNQGSASAGDLVLNWTDSLSVVRNSNFQRIFNAPITIEGGDGFKLTGTDNVGNAAHIDAVIIDVTFVPEPSSLALLGLGGLLIARRRR